MLDEAPAVRFCMHYGANSSPVQCLYTVGAPRHVLHIGFAPGLALLWRTLMILSF